jgi:hypothetical protein
VDKIIHGASGLGDAVYLYPIAKRLLDEGHDVTILTNYPTIYETLKCKTAPFDKTKGESYSYVNRKHIPETDQYIDMCINAEMYPNYPPLTMDYQSKALYHYEPIAVVVAPCVPFGQSYRPDYECIMPNVKAMDDYIETLKRDYTIIQVGKNPIIKLYSDVDLTGNTTLDEYINLLFNADLIVSQVGNALSFAEAFNNKATIFFPLNARNSDNQFLRTITAEKVIHKKNLIKSITC